MQIAIELKLVISLLAAGAFTWLMVAWYLNRIEPHVWYRRAMRLLLVVLLICILSYASIIHL